MNNEQSGESLEDIKNLLEPIEKSMVKVLDILESQQQYLEELITGKTAQFNRKIQAYKEFSQRNPPPERQS